jgi:hypothetical protein
MKLNEIMEEFENLPDNEKINILEKALVRMQFYNGRSRDEVISWSMGYLPNIDGNYISNNEL